MKMLNRTVPLLFIVCLGLVAVGVTSAAPTTSQIALEGIMKVIEPGTMKSVELEIGDKEGKLYYYFPKGKNVFLKEGRYRVTVYVERMP